MDVIHLFIGIWVGVNCDFKQPEGVKRKADRLAHPNVGGSDRFHLQRLDNQATILVILLCLFSSKLLMTDSYPPNEKKIIPSML